jgi:hypothetical protein
MELFAHLVEVGAVALPLARTAKPCRLGVRRLVDVGQMTGARDDAFDKLALVVVIVHGQLLSEYRT